MRVIFIIFLCISLAQPVFKYRDYYFTEEPDDISMKIYGSDPFVECVEIAKYIKQRAAPTDRIAVLGSEPEIFFYTGLRSATRYIYANPLMEMHKYAEGMQREMIREIESVRPRFLIFENVATAWAIEPRSERLIFEWFQNYVAGHYYIAGAVDLYKDGLSEYLWDDDASSYAPGTKNFLIIYERIQ